MSNNDGIRYSDKAIWVDENAYKEDCDQQKLFSYIRDICMALATTRKMMQNPEEYSDFADYMACRIYMRYKDARQYDERRQNFKRKKMSKIKSVSNYVNDTIFYLKSQYNSENFQYTWKKKEIEEDTPSSLISLIDCCVADTRDMEFRSDMHSIPATIDRFLSKIPKKKNSLEWHNIKISCMLTILNYISLTKQEKRRIVKIQHRKDHSISDINKIYQDAKYREPILYNLPDEMANYIAVLSRKIIREIAFDLSETVGYFTTANNMISDVLSDGNKEEEK